MPAGWSPRGSDDLQCRPGVHPGDGDKVDTEEYRLLPFRFPAALEVFRYAEEIALERRREPRDDIITTLLTSEPDGEPLTDLEFKTFFTLLMVAGNETTRHTISHWLVSLQENPDQ